MNTNLLLDDKILYKNKYLVKWCELCECFSFKCEKCGNVSCNGGACDDCLEDSKEFRKLKTSIHEYFTDEENMILLKAHRTKHFIELMLKRNETKIDFEKLDSEGFLSTLDRKFFLGK